MAETHAPVPVRVEVLGPLRLVVDGATVDVAGTKRRAVLALLAMARGRTVTVEHLVDALWPSQVPESGRPALHTLVSRVRSHLGPASDRLETRREGYRLRLGDDELDVARARAALAAARAEDRDPAAVLDGLREAYGLWRGPVLADLTGVDPIAAAARECAQLHRDVTDALITAAVAAGQAESVVEVAATSLSDDPLREPAVLLAMRALAATGAAAEALRTGHEYRRRLVDEAGLDPSPALAELERDVAGGALGPPPAAARPARTPAAGARPTTRLVGREATIAALHRLVTAERLVTVVGPGGVGKTRVAWEVAHAGEGAPVLSLAPVTDAAAVPHALAAALNLNVDQGDVLAACVAVLGDRPGLLVIDNCEHLLDAVHDLVEIVLSSCPNLSVLATSREPLGVPGEYTFRLPPLPLPRAGQDPARAPSVALFLDRARARPGPPPGPDELRAVADVVRRLDGMPLAIELAAGRLSTFSLTDLRDRLDRSLDLLGGGRAGGASRHRTLRATVDWSYQLLGDEERRLFRYLAVFPDGADLDTVERLAEALGLAADPGSVLARLVDASMIDADFSAGTRFRMLQTLRAFGLDRLDAEREREAAAGYLTRWAVDLTGWFASTVTTEHEPEADAVLRRELTTLRAAWRSARVRGDLDAAVAMVTGLFDAVGYRDLTELRDWAGELADDPALADHPRAAAAMGVAAEAAYHSGEHRRAERLARAGLDRAGGAPDGWYGRVVLSVVALARGALADAAEHAVAAAGLETGVREAFGIAALAALYAGDGHRARTLNARGLAGAASPTMRAWGAYVAGEIDSAEGDDERAERHYTRAVDLARGSGATFVVGVATVGLLAVQVAAGRLPEALNGYRRVVDYFAGTGNWTHQWATLRDLAGLLRRLGDDETATMLELAADRAPDAPAVAGPAAAAEPGPTGIHQVAVPSRDDVLEAARAAVDRHLTCSSAGPPSGSSRGG